MDGLLVGCDVGDVGLKVGSHVGVSVGSHVGTTVGAQVGLDKV